MTDKETAKTAEQLKGFFAAITFPATDIVRGFVLRQLWEWFAIPQFHLAPISLPMVLGIALIVRLMTITISGVKDTQSYWQRVGMSIGISLIALAYGWVYRMFL